MDHSKDIIASIAKGLATPNGKALLDFLKTQYNNVTTISYDNNGKIDPYQTHFNEGCRHVYLKLEEVIEKFKKEGL